MEIHIGNLVKSVAENKKIKVAELAKKIGQHPGSVSRFFGYDNMQISLVKKLSIALDYDFFAHYSDELKIAKGRDFKSEIEKTLEEKNREIEQLKQENGYLKEINELLRKK